MKKRFIFILFIFIGWFVITGCSNNKDSLKFKEEYEGLNGTKTSYSDSNYRSVNISKRNPFVYSTADDILDMINNKETFYVYFGSSYCQWCRSVIEEAINSSIDNKIDKIFYVDIWDGFHNEILRDTYEIDSEGNVRKTKNGTDTYYKLLKKFDNVLEDYTLTDDSSREVNVGEKRIFAPNFIYVENGKAKRSTTGISDKQGSSGDKLSKDILRDESKAFDKFFS